MKNILKLITIALLSIGSIDAKTGGGGFSSSSRSSSSSSSSSRPSSGGGWGSSSKPSVSPSPAASKPSTPSSTWSSSSSPSKPSSATTSTTPPAKSWATKTQTSTRPVSAVEQQRYQAAVKSGKTFQTRDAAVADFKAKEASKYSSRFAAEPATRPDYIPQKYGNNTIVYNQGGGGYGYYSGGGPGLGTFILYDMASDAIMMNSMMARQNYYVGGPPQPQVVYTTTTNGWAVFWSWFLGIVIATIFIVILFNCFRSL